MAVKNSQRFAEIERLMGDYFGCHLAPVMGRVQRDLSNRQADEMRAYSNSTAGILRSLATANMPGDDPYATLKITGKWNSKTTEDYLAMCKEAIVGNKDMQRDLAVMAEEWRKAVVTEIRPAFQRARRRRKDRVLRFKGRSEAREPRKVRGEGARLRRRLTVDDSLHRKNPLERGLETTPF